MSVKVRGGCSSYLFVLHFRNRHIHGGEKKKLRKVFFFLLTIKKEKSATVTVSHSDLFLASVLSVLLRLIKQEAYNQTVRFINRHCALAKSTQCIMRIEFAEFPKVSCQANDAMA